MPFFNPLKSLFPSQNEDLMRLMRHEERKIRRKPTSQDQVFSPELERLRYEVLRSSI